ncbi:hypothetical protein C4G81_RS22200 [Vibrio parahaemolyticus]|nr:hypothetical protein [Vibrio parahaemolyticus]
MASNVGSLKDQIKPLVEQLVTFDLSEKDEAVICSKIDKLSPDPRWSEYIFWSDEYIDENQNFLVDQFLEKIFSYKTITSPPR